MSTTNVASIIKKDGNKRLILLPASTYYTAEAATALAHAKDKLLAQQGKEFELEEAEDLSRLAGKLIVTDDGKLAPRQDYASDFSGWVTENPIVMGSVSSAIPETTLEVPPVKATVDLAKTAPAPAPKPVAPAPSSSSHGEGGVIPEAMSYSLASTGTINPVLLTAIRSFRPAESDKEMVFLEYEPSTSSALIHRQRYMALLRRGVKPEKIRDWVENKAGALIYDKEQKALVAGIPRRKMELFLSDKVLIGESNPSYAPFLRLIYVTMAQAPIAELVKVAPAYIGQGAKGEKGVTEAETELRRARYARDVQEYLRPLYTNTAFRRMIDEMRPSE